MNRKKISVPKRVKDQIDKYPMVVVEWYDIVSNSSWSSFDELKKSKAILLFLFSTKINHLSMEFLFYA